MATLTAQRSAQTISLRPFAASRRRDVCSFRPTAAHRIGASTRPSPVSAHGPLLAAMCRSARFRARRPLPHFFNGVRLVLRLARRERTPHHRRHRRVPRKRRQQQPQRQEARARPIGRRRARDDRGSAKWSSAFQRMQASATCITCSGAAGVALQPYKAVRCKATRSSPPDGDFPKKSQTSRGRVGRSPRQFHQFSSLASSQCSYRRRQGGLRAPPARP